MRSFATACGTTLAAIILIAANASAATPSSLNAKPQIAAHTKTTYEVARGGCGSKGGPGYRKSNGKCASWRG